MRYYFSCMVYFEIEADNYDHAIEKGWEKVRAEIPECFETEGTELWCEAVCEDEDE